jgi:hypothetical protein
MEIILWPVILLPIAPVIPAEIFAEIAIYQLGAWRALYSSCKSIWNKMKPLTDTAKTRFVRIHYISMRDDEVLWYALPCGWRHGVWKRIITYYNGKEVREVNYRNDRLHGSFKIWSKGKLWRECEAYEGKAHGEWKQWNCVTDELEGWVTLDKGKIIKVHKWIYARYDSDLKDIIVGKPLDSEFVFS